MIGIYFRVERNGRFESVELENLTEKERNNALKDFGKDALLKTIGLLCKNAVILENAYELACEVRDDWGGREYSGSEFNNYHDYFIAKAIEKLNIKLK